MDTQTDKKTVNPTGQVTIKPTEPDPEGDLVRDLLNRVREAMSERTPTFAERRGTTEQQDPEPDGD
jgi:hypothetical protein